MKRVYLICFVAISLAVASSAQQLYNGVGHIPASRQEEWYKAGLQKKYERADYVINITTKSGANWDERVQNALIEARGYAAQKLMTIIYFPAGTYILNYSITLNAASGDSNIVFQGDGSGQTVFQFEGNPSPHCFYITGTISDFGSNQVLNIIPKGSTVLTGNFPSGQSTSIAAGDWIQYCYLDFDYDPRDNLEVNIIGQVTKVTAKTTSSLTIKDKASMSYFPNFPINPSVIHVRKITPIRNIGIENLSIKRTNISSGATACNFYFSGAVNCWIKGIESNMTSMHHVDVTLSSHLYICGSYFHHAEHYDGANGGYGVLLYGSTTNTLVENNVFNHLRHALIVGGGANTNVYTYNYSRDEYAKEKVDLVGWVEKKLSDCNVHAKYPFANLFEQNYVETIHADSWHGKNGPYNTFVRNYCYKPGLSTEGIYYSNVEIWLQRASDSNILGNEGTYGGYRVAASIDYDDTSPDVFDVYGYTSSGLGLKHNYVRFQGLEMYCILYDISYHYSSRPAFLGSNFTWPSLGLGPGYSLSHSIPAKERWDTGNYTYQAGLTSWPVTASGTLTSNVQWSGTINIVGNLTVSSGHTLTILPGTNIRFTGYFTITVQSGAKIIAEGTSASPITFTSLSGSLPPQWKYIELQGGNNVFKYCNCSYGTYSFFLNGCTADKGTANLFENCSFKYNSVYGIRFDNSVAKLVTCNIDDNNQIGVRAYYSTVDFTGTGIRRNKSRGVYTPGGNTLRFYGTVIENNAQYGLEIRYVNTIFIGKQYGWYGYNTIRNNGNTEVHAYQGSSLSSIGMNYSSIHDDNGGLEVYNASGNSQIFAQNCYWGPDFVCNKSGDVYPHCPLTTIPGWDGTTRSTGGPFKASSPEINTDIFLIDPTLPEEDQVKQCKALIASGPDKKEAVEALVILYGILRPDYIKNELGERDSFRDYVGSLWTSHPGKAIGKMALQYLIIWDILSGDDGQAIDLSKKALKVLEKEEANCVMYDLAYSYLRKGWTDNAKECLKLLKKHWDSKENSIWQLEEDIKETDARIAKGLIQPDESLPSETTEELPEEAAMLQNYPNPGNPTTMIQYQLPEARRVVLRIYNILGEEIATLIDRQEEAGVHQVVWNGKDRAGLPVSTGIYIYRLEAGEHVFTKKLMLMK